jgi:hypothetical protein
MELGQLRTQNGRKMDGSENIMAISNYILRQLVQNKSHNSMFNNTYISQINTSPPGLVLPTIIIFPNANFSFVKSERWLDPNQAPRNGGKNQKRLVQETYLMDNI